MFHLLETQRVDFRWITQTKSTQKYVNNAVHKQQVMSSNSVNSLGSESVVSVQRGETVNRQQ